MKKYNQLALQHQKSLAELKEVQDRAVNQERDCLLQIRDHLLQNGLHPGRVRLIEQEPTKLQVLFYFQNNTYQYLLSFVLGGAVIRTWDSNLLRARELYSRDVRRGIAKFIREVQDALPRFILGRLSK